MEEKITTATALDGVVTNICRVANGERKTYLKIKWERFEK